MSNESKYSWSADLGSGTVLSVIATLSEAYFILRGILPYFPNLKEMVCETQDWQPGPRAIDPEGVAHSAPQRISGIRVVRGIGPAEFVISYEVGKLTNRQE
jgi:hypothetical protein